MNSILTKRSKMIKADILMSDITRLIDEVPSDYTKAKQYLNEARSIIRSEPNKAFKSIKKAHSLVVKESIAATQYNSIRDRLPLISDSYVLHLDERYHYYLKDGKFKQAQKYASFLDNQTSSLACPISVSLLDYCESYATISIINLCKRQIFVTSLEGYHEDKCVKFSPPSFNIQPNETTRIKCENISEVGFTLKINFIDGSEHRNKTTFIKNRGRKG